MASKESTGESGGEASRNTSGMGPRRRKPAAVVAVAEGKKSRHPCASIKATKSLQRSLGDADVANARGFAIVEAPALATIGHANGNVQERHHRAGAGGGGEE
mmetsp:Transcript_73872/g.161657  ORF Transcript_73872/g.161657 Transcript_73872/m.161657 type:complete len:102 (-) Transcript_73872:881-1186(-)